MSLIIKEGQETGGSAEILYNNPLVNPYRNFFNELYILKSYPLIEDVVEELNFMVGFYKEGNIKTSQVYKPFNLVFDIHNKVDQEIYDKQFVFSIISNSKFNLEFGDKSFQGNFNDTLLFQGVKFSVLKDAEEHLEELYDEKFIVRITDPKIITSSYVARLRAEWAEVGASVINLDINGKIPQKEIDFMNTLAAKYTNRDLQQKLTAAAQSLTFIDMQLKDISDSLENYENRMESFKAQNTGDLGAEAERLLEKAQSLEATKTELTIRKNYFDYLENYIQEDQTLDMVILPSSVGISDPVLSTLVSNMIQLQLEAKTIIHTENPLSQNLLNRLNDTKRNIAQSISTLKSTDNIRMDEIDRQIDAIERQLRFLPRAERQLITIKRNFSLNENLFIFLMQKRAEAGITKASTTSDIRVVNPAMLAGGPVSPNERRNYLIAVLLGLGIPIGIFVVQEQLNNRIRSKEEINSLTDIPVIGGVGHKSIDTNLVVKERAKSSVSESFRSLRSNLNYFTSNKGRKVFLITSSISGEGKSFTTINLATVFAISGMKTLIIGADLRKPKIYNDFNLSNDFGLTNYLTGSMTYKEIIQPTFIENLDLISAGPIPPNPSELLMRDDMDQLIRLALEEYNYIILDTPPIALVTDAFVISKLVDHTIYVARQNYTPQEGIKMVNELHKQKKIENISILLNDIKGIMQGYNGYGYGYGYGYGNGYYDDDKQLKKSLWQRFTLKRKSLS